MEEENPYQPPRDADAPNLPRRRKPAADPSAAVLWIPAQAVAGAIVGGVLAGVGIGGPFEFRIAGGAAIGGLVGLWLGMVWRQIKRHLL